MVPLTSSLLGMVGYPPLWQHSNGCDFVVGNKWRSWQQHGKMSREQVAAIMKCWTRIDPPDLPLFVDMAYSISQTDWFAIDDQHIPPSLIKAGFSNTNQQQVRVQEASEKTRKEISRLCFQRMRDTVTWKVKWSNRR